MRKYVPLMALVCSAGSPVVAQSEGEPVHKLEAFIVEETLTESSGQILPLERNLEGLYGSGTDVFNLPRSVSVLTPEAMRLHGIESFEDLSAAGAGTQRVNFFGIAGTPFIRGALAGTYFNGMLRAFQRNEMPTSFGSLEALDVVKGPAPSHLAPTLVGGFVNMVPKSPFFDRERGRVSVSVGSWDKYRAQLDYGGPFLVGELPAAWRVSLTAQDADSYYNNVQNDFVSLYLAGKVRLDDTSSIFTGTEYYKFRSGEIPGWNRPTQELIDRGRYVLGEPVSIVDPAWGGRVNRTLVEWPNNAFTPHLNALALPGDVARAQIAPELLAHMINLNTPEGLERAYRVLTRDEVLAAGGFVPAWASPDAARQAVQQVNPQPQDLYVYTPEYFAAGGTALTAPISGNQVLSDENDYANSEDFIWFFDWERNRGQGERMLNQVFVERLETRKLSTYGFSIYTDQLILADKFTIEQPVDSLGSTFTYGAELRYSWAKMRQDFFAEPFSRRDLTRPEVSANSVVPTGPQTAPDGLNLWSPGLGANEESRLYQAAIFGLGDTRIGERLRIFYSLRGEWANWDTTLPGEVDRRDRAPEVENAGSITFFNGSINPVITLTQQLNLYGAVQQGRALGPGDGGTIAGRESFTDVKLYEVGLKGSFLNSTLFASLAAYRWEQSVYRAIDARSFPLRAKGVEFELIFKPTSQLSIMASADVQRVNLESDVVGYGTLPFTEEEWALYGGIMNATSGRPTPGNPENIYAGFPEISARLLVVYELPNGFGISAGPYWRDAHWANHDRTLRLPESTLWNAFIYWRNDRWDISLRIENITDEDYYLASDPVFSANTLVTKGTPTSWELRAAWNF